MTFNEKKLERINERIAKVDEKRERLVKSLHDEEFASKFDGARQDRLRKGVLRVLSELQRLGRGREACELAMVRDTKSKQVTDMIRRDMPDSRCMAICAAEFELEGLPF